MLKLSLLQQFFQLWYKYGSFPREISHTGLAKVFCIFQPAFGCCALVKMYFFNIFLCKKAEKARKAKKARKSKKFDAKSGVFKLAPECWSSVFSGYKILNQRSSANFYRIISAWCICLLIFSAIKRSSFLKLMILINFLIQWYLNILNYLMIFIRCYYLVSVSSTIETFLAKLEWRHIL